MTLFAVPIRKILFTVHQFFPEFCAGTEVLTLNTAKELQRRGYEVGVVTLGHTDVPKDFRHGGLRRADFEEIPVWKLDYNFYQTPNPLTNEFNNPYMAEFMDEFLAEYKPDLVHIMHIFRFSASVIDVYIRYNIPIVMTATDFWFLCSRIQLRDSSNRDCSGPEFYGANCIRCIAKQTNSSAAVSLEKIPLALIGLGTFFASMQTNPSDNIKAVQFLSQRLPYLIKQLNKVNRVIVPTEIMKKMLLNKGVNKDLITKLHFGINTEQTTSETKIKKYKGQITFGFIGSIVEHKGLHVLAKAFSGLEAENVSLLIYGDTDTDPSYTIRIKEIAGKDNRIKFMGTFPNSRIKRVFEGIDVLVVPSIWYENTPLVIFSAFDAKTPVIVTDLAGLTEVVKHEKNGLVFPKNDDMALRNILQRFLNEHGLLGKLSDQIESVKTISENVNELEIIYKELLSKE